MLGAQEGRMMRRILVESLLAMSLVTLQAPPGLAVPASHTAEAPPEPWVAAALSVLGTPVVALGLGALAGTLEAGGGDAMMGAMLATPLLMGAGHVYAGDWKRGVLVGLGAEAAVLGAGLAASLVPRPADNGTGVLMLFAGMGAGAAYSVWAGYDAHETARRAGQPSAATQP
jgi:hypothetical protein